MYSVEDWVAQRRIERHRHPAIPLPPVILPRWENPAKNIEKVSAEELEKLLSELDEEPIDRFGYRDTTLDILIGETIESVLVEDDEYR